MKKGISIIETDLEVDFAAPLGYVEPARVAKKMTGPGNSLGGTTDSLHAHVTSDGSGDVGFAAFGGDGMKLNGKAAARAAGREGVEDARGGKTGIEALNLPDGFVFLGYPVVPVAAAEGARVVEKSRFEGLGGGETLRAARKKDV
jgi:ubiquitin fusion degradation protein 1